jgi:hypothetical protein
MNVGPVSVPFEQLVNDLTHTTGTRADVLTGVVPDRYCQISGPSITGTTVW